MMNWKRCRMKESWHNRGTIQEFAWEGEVNHKKTSVGIASALAEIRNEHVPNTSVQPYHYPNLLG
jgi:hypothetical protein